MDEEKPIYQETRKIVDWFFETDGKLSEIIFIHIKTCLHQVNTSIYDNIYIRQRPLLVL